MLSWTGFFFFRATDRGRIVSQKPFLGSAVNKRLSKYLMGAMLDCGETRHSSRLGFSNSLSMPVVRKVTYPVTWDSALRVWFSIILGSLILLVLFLFPLRIPFTRSRHLISATYNMMSLCPPRVLFCQPLFVSRFPLGLWLSGESGER